MGEQSGKSAELNEKVEQAPLENMPKKFRTRDLLRRAAVGLMGTLAFGAATTGSLLLFRMLNRTKVYGLKNVPREHTNVLYCLNHCSLLDNFAFESAAYVPKVLFQRKYLPISLADRKNFFGDPNGIRFKDKVMRLLGEHFFKHIKAYPVDRNKGSMGQVDDWIRLIKDNIVIVFPEGTRTRTGEIGPGKPGVGRLIYEAHPVVMPVHMAGTADILGVGQTVPSIFRTIRVYIGKPMDLEYLLNQPLPEDKRERMLFYASISDAVLNEIRALNPCYGERFSLTYNRRNTAAGVAEKLAEHDRLDDNMGMPNALPLALEAKVDVAEVLASQEKND